LIEGHPKGNSPPTTPTPSGTSETSSPRHSNYFDLSFPSSLDDWETWRQYSLRVFVRTFKAFTGFEPQGRQLQKRFDDAFPEWTRSYDPLTPGPHYRVIDLIASPGDEDRSNGEVYDRYIVSTTVWSITQTPDGLSWWDELAIRFHTIDILGLDEGAPNYHLLELLVNSVYQLEARRKKHMMTFMSLTRSVGPAVDSPMMAVHPHGSSSGGGSRSGHVISWPS
jgi:hypothetical protein